jgi:hypothetical protein
MQDINPKDYAYLIGRDARKPNGERVRVQIIKADGSAIVERIGGENDGASETCDVRTLTLDQ